MAKDPALQKIIDDVKTKKFRDGEAKGLIETIGGEIKTQLAPLFSGLAKELVGTLKDAVKELKVEVPKQDAPQVTIPDFPAIPPFPEMKAPIVNVPAPVVNVPAPVVNVSPTPVTFPSEMTLKKGTKPFPVMMVDEAGAYLKPQVNPSAGVSGGKADFFTVLGIQNTIGMVQVNPDGAPFYSSSAAGASSSFVSLVNADGVRYDSANPLPTTASLSVPVGQGDSASALRVVQAGDSVSSVVVNSGTITTVTTVGGITNTIAVNLEDSSGVGYSGSNPVPVQLVSGGSATTASALVDSSGAQYSGSNPLPTTATLTVPVGQGDTASAMRVVHAGDSAASVSVLDFAGNPPAQGLNETTAGVLRTVLMSDTAVSVVASVNKWGGSAVTTGLNETGVGTIRAVLMSDTAVSMNAITFNGNAPAQGLNETTAGVLRVVSMTDHADSVNVVTFNGNAPAQGTNETVAGVLRTITMSDTASSSQSKVIAMTTLPTAVGDATSTFQKSDKLGRGVNTPIQVRDLVSTAYVAKATGSTFGTETTLIAGVAGNFLDLIYILGTNDSSASVNCDIRAGTAGNVVMTLTIPSGGTAGVALPRPLPQDNQGNNWTIDLPDITGTNVNITALFTKEI